MHIATMDLRCYSTCTLNNYDVYPEAIDCKIYMYIHIVKGWTVPAEENYSDNNECMAIEVNTIHIIQHSHKLCD